MPSQLVCKNIAIKRKRERECVHEREREREEKRKRTIVQHLLVLQTHVQLSVFATCFNERRIINRKFFFFLLFCHSYVVVELYTSAAFSHVIYR